jgi:uncharacterized membrane-anchored protein
MSARFQIAALTALCIAQLGVSGWSIVRYETILSSGTPYKIRVSPVDPADAFRGRYVTVQPSIRITPQFHAEKKRFFDEVQYGRRPVYVKLAVDAEGFARAADIVADAPREGDYLEIAGVWPTWTPRADDPGKSELTGYTLRFSFDRYYMNEAAAPAAQHRYAQAVPQTGNASAWLAVRVRNGAAVIEGLFVGGVAIEDLVRH